nr:plasmid mobilization relaxosome protein MobC [uncultured Sulfurimonas sp.]
MGNFDKRLQVRCSQLELNELDKKIAKAKLSKSQFLRDVIFSSVIKELDKEHQKRVLFLLNNISNNVNQIAHYANIKRDLDEKVLAELLEVSNFCKSVAKA